MKRAIAIFLGLAICAAAALGFIWALYEVARIGTCASGGPYVSARECPPGTGTRIMVLVLSVFGGLIGTGIYAAGARGLRPARVPLPIIMWFLLFVGGAAAMLLAAYGPAANQDEGVDIAAIIITVVFVPMGTAPVIGSLKWGGKARAAFEIPSTPIATPISAVSMPSVSVPPPVPTPSGGGDSVARLERLAELHRRGDLTDEEFASLKRDVLR